MAEIAYRLYVGSYGQQQTDIPPVESYLVEPTSESFVAAMTLRQVRFACEAMRIIGLDPNEYGVGVFMSGEIIQSFQSLMGSLNTGVRLILIQIGELAFL